MSVKNIAIIGAGAAGLVSAKEVLEKGLVPTIFEKCDSLGGVWNPETGAVWPTMKTNVTKYNMNFGDTPAPQEDFMVAPQVQSYLMHYSEKWGLEPYIHYNCKVLKVHAHSKGSEGWTVEWRDAEDSAVKSQKFHGLIVANGWYSIPHIPPNIPGLGEFPGLVIHSRSYRVPEKFQGLTVLVLGGSLSSNEVISSIYPLTKEIIHCFKRPFWVFKRWNPDPDHKDKKLIPLDFILFTRKFQSHLNSIKGDDEKTEFANRFFAKFCEDQQKIDELKVHESEFKGSVQLTISDGYCEAVKEGKIKVEKQGLKELKGNIAILEDGKEYEIDAIILATGYEMDFSIYEEDVLEAMEYSPGNRFVPFLLFEGTINPKLDNLHFIGVVKEPNIINMEQQARFASRILSGKMERPAREEMESAIEKLRQLRNSGVKVQFPFGDFPSWTDKLGKHNGNFNVDKLLDKECPIEETFPAGIKFPEEWKGKEEIIRKLLIEGPFLACHYDFQQRPKEVLEVLEKVAEILK